MPRIDRSCKLVPWKLVLALVLVLSPAGYAGAYEREVAELANELAGQLAGEQAANVAVVDSPISAARSTSSAASSPRRSRSR